MKTLIRIVGMFVSMIAFILAIAYIPPNYLTAGFIYFFLFVFCAKLIQWLFFYHTIKNYNSDDDDNPDPFLDGAVFLRTSTFWYNSELQDDDS